MNQNPLIIAECLINRDGSNPFGFIHTVCHQSQSNRKNDFQFTRKKNVIVIWMLYEEAEENMQWKKGKSNLRKISETHANIKRTKI